MKRNCLIALVLIFGVYAYSMPPVASGEQEKTTVISNQLSEEESKIIENEMVTFGQILFLYATEALEKPADLRLCAYEMFRLKSNENSCRDKYSSWASEEEAEFFKSDIEGKFGGVGLEIANKEGKVVVITPIDGAPAFRAGLKPADEIIKINDKPVLNPADAVTRLRGKPGTPVKITVKRGEREISFKIIREIITVHAVSAKTVNSPSGGTIGYVKVREFSKITPEEFRKEIAGLRDKGVDRVILDFRNNPGGLLNSALDILYDFARLGDTLITMRERNKETVFDTNYVAPIIGAQEILFERIKITTREPGTFRGIKVVVLINKGSASASEIFAGAMKDWGFPVVGANSFGKGVGQAVIPLNDGSTLSLTTFEFLVGNSKTKINDIGVIPTYEVPDPAPPLPAETPREDRKLEKAIEILSR